MKAHVVAIAAIAGSLFLAPAMIEHANAGPHGGGGMSHIVAAHVGHIGGNMGHFRSGHIGGTQIAGMGGLNGNRWHGGSAWHGNNGNNWHGNNMHGHDHNHFAHNHHRHFDNRFVGVGIGWWPGYYSYGYGSCGWLRRQAAVTGSPYWWDRYYACVNYDYY